MGRLTIYQRNHQYNRKISSLKYQSKIGTRTAQLHSGSRVRPTVNLHKKNTGFFEMIVGFLTTCHTQHT